MITPLWIIFQKYVSEDILLICTNQNDIWAFNLGVSYSYFIVISCVVILAAFLSLLLLLIYSSPSSTVSQPKVNHLWFWCCTFLNTESAFYSWKLLTWADIWRSVGQSEWFSCQTQSLSAILCVPGNLRQPYRARCHHRTHGRCVFFFCGSWSPADSLLLGIKNGPWHLYLINWIALYISVVGTQHD